jgi:hypothetical protein
MPIRPLFLGNTHAPGGATPAPHALLPHHLVTHAAIVGMTGSGKTGLVMVLVEEALRSGVPVLMIDIKGDLPNLLLTFPELDGPSFEPWLDAIAAERRGKTVADAGLEHASRAREGLARWGLGSADVAALRGSIAPRLITPGTTAGEPLHVLSALENAAPLFHQDEEIARDALSASISLLLRLVGRDADPARSREHVFLSHLAERRFAAGLPSGLGELLADLMEPPITTVGAMAVDDFLSPKERKDLAQALNALIASPTFAAWQKGASLDVGAWLSPKDGKTPAVIVSVAHLDDQERALVLGLVLEELLAWVRGLPGTSELRALVVFDEVFGFLPPHPANPPTKRPLLALLKQARAFGVGLVLATQNPMDLDYKALSNAGAWFVGRLQTDADRERVVDGLATSDGGPGGLDREALTAALKALPPRQFYFRNVHAHPASTWLETRYAMSWLRGPMTRRELVALTRALGTRPAQEAAAPKAALPAPASSPAAAAAATPASPATLPRPATPEGLRVVYAYPPRTAQAFRYAPWFAATAIAHLRDAKLGVSLNHTFLVGAPLGADGRLDTTRAVPLDPATLSSEPSANVPFSSLPEGLSKKTTQASLVKALREHVYRSMTLTVDVHEELGLVRGDSELPAAFAVRCRDAATKAAFVEEQRLAQKLAPKLAVLDDRRDTVRAQRAGAEAEVASLPGSVATALLGLAVGRGTVRKTESQRGRAEVRLEKLRSEEQQVEAARGALLAQRDAAILQLRQGVLEVAGRLSTRTLRPKKTDVELSGLTLAWGAEPVG